MQQQERAVISTLLHSSNTFVPFIACLRWTCVYSAMEPVRTGFHHMETGKRFCVGSSDEICLCDDGSVIKLPLWQLSHICLQHKKQLDALLVLIESAVISFALKVWIDIHRGRHIIMTNM